MSRINSPSMWLVCTFGLVGALAWSQWVAPGLAVAITLANDRQAEWSMNSANWMVLAARASRYDFKRAMVLVERDLRCVERSKGAFTSEDSYHRCLAHLRQIEKLGVEVLSASSLSEMDSRFRVIQEEWKEAKSILQDESQYDEGKANTLGLQTVWIAADDALVDLLLVDPVMRLVPGSE